MQSQGITPDEACYRRTMDACAKHCNPPSLRMEYALQLLRIQEAGGPVDAYILAQAISVCGEASGANAALGVLERYGDAADDRCLTNVVTACAREGRIDLLQELLRTVRQKGVAIAPATYNAALGACFDAKDLLTAMELFEEARTLHVPVDAVIDTVIVSQVLPLGFFLLRRWMAAVYP